MPTALFLSPHLDDVAFSCAGTLIRLLQAGWSVKLATIFTAILPDPQGFALQRQTEQGIDEAVDYMALRQAEDLNFARAVNLRDWQHWGFLEAPYRGYHTKAELFAGIQPDDEVWRPISDRLCETIQSLRPDALFAPQGLSNHVDHLQTILAIKATDNLITKTRWYREAAYVIRHPNALPSSLYLRISNQTVFPSRRWIWSANLLDVVPMRPNLIVTSETKAKSPPNFHRREAQSLESTRMERYAECFLTPKDSSPLF